MSWRDVVQPNQFLVFYCPAEFHWPIVPQYYFQKEEDAVSCHCGALYDASYTPCLVVNTIEEGEKAIQWAKQTIEVWTVTENLIPAWDRQRCMEALQ
jgi:hypothetical protein